MPSLFQRAWRAHSPFTATRLRLLLMNILVVSAMIGAMAVSVYAWEAQITDQQITQDIEDHAARDLGRNLALINGTTTGAGAQDNQRDGDPIELYEPSSPNVFTVLLNAQGTVVADAGNVRALGLPDLQAVRPVLAGHVDHTLVTIGDDAHAFRLYTVAVRERGTVVGAVQTGMSLASRSRQLHGLLATLLLVGAAMLLLTAFVSLFLADRALAPTREAYERERRFVAAASHELRTPLAIVRSQAELVSRHLRNPSHSGDVVDSEVAQELAGDVDEITREADYMTRLVRDLLLLARSDAQMDAPRAGLGIIDLWEVAEDSISKLRPQAETRGLSLSLDDGGPGKRRPALMLGDPDRVRQLMFIFLENALTHTPNAGNIVVGISAHTGRSAHVGFHVSDTGPGISEQDLPHIFEPFYRVYPSRGATEHVGAGLGLALARTIAQSLGGRISVNSTVGVGSTFTVTFPEASCT